MFAAGGANAMFVLPLTESSEPVKSVEKFRRRATEPTCVPLMYDMTFSSVAAPVVMSYAPRGAFSVTVGPIKLRYLAETDWRGEAETGVPLLKTFTFLSLSRRMGFGMFIF